MQLYEENIHELGKKIYDFHGIYIYIQIQSVAGAMRAHVTRLSLAESLTVLRVNGFEAEGRLQKFYKNEL